MQILPLTKDYATKHLTEIVELVQQIPQTEYSAATVLAESKEQRIFHGKWERSLVLVDDQKVIGLIMGYERGAEENEQYPKATIYISELAVDPEYRGQGLGKKLIKEFLAQNQKIGMQVFPDQKLNFSLQTNSAEFNSVVINLYAAFGFKFRARKHYPTRVDVVMGWTP